MGLNKEQLKEPITKLMEELGHWNKYLEGKEWFAETFSLADITVFPAIAGSVFLGLNLDSHFSK